MTYRIMIVEDEYWTAMDLAQEVKKRGATVTGPFSSIAQVIEELSGPRRPDAAVVDIRLRTTDVFSVADMLVQKEIPFVFATAHVPRDIPERFAETPHFEKPFASEACVEKVLALAEEHRSQGR